MVDIRTFFSKVSFNFMDVIFPVMMISNILVISASENCDDIDIDIVQEYCTHQNLFDLNNLDDRFEKLVQNIIHKPESDKKWSVSGKAKMGFNKNASHAAHPSAFGFGIKRLLDEVLPVDLSLSMATNNSFMPSNAGVLNLLEKSFGNMLGYGKFTWQGVAKRILSEQHGIGIEVGKIDSLIGMGNVGEGVGSASSSWMSSLVPAEHIGAKLDWKASKNIHVSSGISNGWQEPLKNIDGTYSVSFSGKYSSEKDTDSSELLKNTVFGGSLYFGHEGAEKGDKSYGGIEFPNKGFSDLQIYNLYGKKEFKGNLSLGLDAVYGVSFDPNTDTWYGINLGASYKKDDTLSFSCRGEFICDEEGLLLKSKNKKDLHYSKLNAYALALALSYKYNKSTSFSAEIKYRRANKDIIDSKDSKLEFTISQSVVV